MALLLKNKYPKSINMQQEQTHTPQELATAADNIPSMSTHEDQFESGENNPGDDELVTADETAEELSDDAPTEDDDAAEDDEDDYDEAEEENGDGNDVSGKE